MDEKSEQLAAKRGRWANVAYSIVYRMIAALFAVCAVLLVGFSCMELYHGVGSRGVELQARFSRVLEAIGMLTIAVAALELSQTVWEEEVQRQALMSAPTRVRRFISRFLVVVVVALAIESLIAAFRFLHEAPEHLPDAAAVAASAALLLIAWGVFIRLNLSAEALEPEGMARAKREDQRIDEENAAPE
jgi:magnesium-transporting ATPase (P-type)